ncbi:ATP-binding protein [Streptomyces sp. NPDC127036]|uniref:ATP-binding protein n=1 Tax=unclassified Streptomyces TaxID=2593676 RepID=UPI00364BF16A
MRDGGEESEGSLSASEVYDGDSSCIGDARRFATAFLTDVRCVHGLPVSERALSVTQLVVSELVTNAVKYAPGPVKLDLEVSAGAVRVSVWDSDPVLPDAAASDPERVGRHGLEIALTVSLAYEVCREATGKRVTALIALTDTQRPRPSGSV